MKKVIKETSKLLTEKPLIPPAWAFRSITSKSGLGVYASSDTLYKGAVFGRDSLEVADDLLVYKPRFVKRILHSIATLQGEVTDDTNEEEPGKIIHEYRTLVVDGKPLDDTSLLIFKELSKRWGGNSEYLAYYGSVDATPLFIKVLTDYCKRFEVRILDEKVKLKSGHVLSMRIVLENAIDWLTGRINNSGTGLLEYQRRNKLGIENQVWKDSKEFYIHKNGEFVNHDKPVASIEVQGLSYDALIGAAEFLPNKKSELKELAANIRDQTIRMYWMKTDRYFALGHDYDDNGETRIIKTLTANPAALLDSRIFDQLTDLDRELYISGIINAIFSNYFLTDAGIRSRSLEEADIMPFWDYHGSFTTWPKETYDIAKGLRRQGFPLLARQLENRILNVVLRNKEYPEFVYVDLSGKVLASSPGAQYHGDVIIVDSTNKPERIQAWTVSAIIGVLNRRLLDKLPKRAKRTQEIGKWKTTLEKELLKHTTDIDKMLNPFALAKRYPHYPYRLKSGKSSQASNFIHIKVEAGREIQEPGTVLQVRQRRKR